MRISCPSCATEYDVPDAALAGRNRMMRCARCGHQWRGPAADVAVARVAEPALEPLPEALPEPLPEAPPAPARAPLEVLTWPEALEIPAPSPPPLEERTFGQPVDRDALAALQAAAISDGGPPLNVPEPEENTATGLSLPERELEPVAAQDRFAELFRSAQDRASIYESEEPPAPPAVKISSNSLVVVLVILLVLALIFLERHFVMHAFPASAKLFHSLGFS
jgi:predicted Zn finger-like uncharacterized protein